MKLLKSQIRSLQSNEVIRMSLKSNQIIKKKI